MTEFRQVFEDRSNELAHYLGFLSSIETQAQNGIPRIGNIIISPEQKQVLYSSFYLQVYNVIEATIITCLEGLSQAVIDEELFASQLTEKLQHEWLRSFTKNGEPLNTQNRLQKTIDLFECLTNGSKLTTFKVEKGGGGNWDDKKIESIVKRLGWNIHVDQPLRSKIKSPYKEEKSLISYITHLRNKLAHGALSFVECGSNVVVSDLIELNEATNSYLDCVVSLFEDVITNKQYISAN